MGLIPTFVVFPKRIPLCLLSLRDRQEDTCGYSSVGLRCDSQSCGTWAIKAPKEKGSYSAKQKNLGRGSQQTSLRGKEWWKPRVLQGEPYKNSKCLVKVCAVETRKGGALHQIDMVSQGGLQRHRWGGGWAGLRLRNSGKSFQFSWDKGLNNN